MQLIVMGWREVSRETGQVMRHWHVGLITIILWAVCFLTLSGGVSPWQLASSVTRTTVPSRVCVCVFACVFDAFAGACICMSHTEKQENSEGGEAVWSTQHIISDLTHSSSH